MPAALMSDLVRVLGELPLLQPVQRSELEQLQRRFIEPKALVQQMVQRGWLTAYQGQRLLQGQAAKLLLGPYVILDTLGEGGMGQIFKARHSGLNRLAAVKVLRPELVSDPEMLQRFLREIKLASQLARHPHLVHAFDAGPVGGTYFLAMEYVEGIDLDRLVGEVGPLPVPQACDYLRQAAWGLQHAFEHGLVHRDIKPANLLVTPRPCKSSAEWGTVKVLDLGLARLHGKGTAPGQTVLTLTSDGTMTMGTVDYMAPEQALDLHRADIRADVYSLGCTFYYLLTGKPPFGGGPLAVKLMRHQQTEPPDLKEFRPDAPNGLIPIIRRMLAKKPDDRYQTPGEVATALDKLFPPKPTHAIPHEARRGEGVQSSLLGWGITRTLRWVSAAARRFWQTFKRRPRLALGAMASVVVGTVVVGWLLGPRSPLGPGPNTPISQLAPETGLARLRARAAERDADEQSLWRDILAFRMKHAGTPEAAAAAELQMTLPSLLDRLEPGRIKDRSKMLPATVAIMEGHRLAEHAIRFSPDGGSIALCGDPTHLELAVYDLTRQEPKLRANLTGHTAALYAVAFSPDGKLIASGSADKTVRLWDMTATPPKLSRVLEGHTGTIRCLAFSPDGRTLASGGEDQTVRTWDLTTAEPRALSILPVKRGVWSLAYFPDGRTLLTGSAAGDGSFVQLWDGLTMPQPRLRRTLNAGVSVLALSPNRPLLASNSAGNGAVNLLDLAGVDPTPLKLAHWHDGGVSAVQFTADGKTVFTSDAVGRFRWWESAEGKSTHSENVALSSVLHAELAPDGRHVAVAPRGNVVYLLRFPQAAAAN
ncbi:MAG: serine/threonine protein kinase [Planctomycetia bacterium]|nr:serine/threonine protein kinase [Planctomycetia bacterium]